jgi:cytochrome c5
MKKLFIASFALLLAGCFSAKQPKQAAAPAVPSPTVQTDVEKAQAKFPNYTLAELTEGKKLYREYCGSCHGLKDVASYTEDAWKQLVPDMSNKVNQKEPLLDAAAQQKILNYVVAVSNASR